MGSIGATKRPVPTPKSVIFQKFGDKASYIVEEVLELSENACPGLAIVQKGPSLFRCCLQLPDFSVTSETFKRKKDAEQDAAQKAIDKLGIHPKEDGLTAEEAWDELVGRLTYFFSNEFFSSVIPFSGSLHPHGGHLRATLKREGQLNGCVPVSVLANYDSKISNLCKYINPEVESSPLLLISTVLKASARLSGIIRPCKRQLSLKRQTPYPLDVLQPLENFESSMPETIQFKAIRIPVSKEKSIQSVTLNVCSNGYYLDVIAQELDATEASRVLFSRTIGKASSEIRLYYRLPESYDLDLSSGDDLDRSVYLNESLNVWGSYLAGQEVYGDAILASIGYTWRSTDLFYDDVFLHTYFRFLMNKTPSGIYKLSREAILAAELPNVYTARSNWKGSYPRDMLFTFCRQHHLSEPLISLQSDSIVGESGPTDSLRCCIKLLTKRQDLLLQCFPQTAYKKQADAIQNVSLKILSWLEQNMFKNPIFYSKKPTFFSEEADFLVCPEYLLKEFASCPYMPTCLLNPLNSESLSIHENSDPSGYTNSSISILGSESGVYPSTGFLVCICYSVILVSDGENMKEHVESNEEFEFEIGTGTVFPYLEAIVTQMLDGQSSFFSVDLPPKEFILAVDHDSSTTQSLLSSSRKCKLEYSVTLLNVIEPMEDRMEQAFFSPPLSKQRVEYALQHIRQSSSVSLVDFGCGSGSLLDSLLDFHTSLEKIVGVDLSTKGLTRAAKILHSKLNDNTHIKSAVLYDGSITNFDSRVYNFDIATCLEVIEHMEEEEVNSFGEVVLGSYCPKILVLSTPNYEYNGILQKCDPQTQEDHDEKNQFKFRNHDHKFEWTRKEFSQWACDLATRYDYNVEFSGVGGTGDVEPGFASQIAVFTRRKDENQTILGLAADPPPYKVMWEWNVVNKYNNM